MRVLITGAEGFLGWHLRARLQASTDYDVVAVGRPNWNELPRLAQGADVVVHLAGVNRGEPTEVEHGNVALARDLAEALRSVSPPPRIIYASSVQSGNGTPYGNGKALAGQVLAQAADLIGSVMIEAYLPNLFGEGGLPDYNSFVATFVDRIVRGERVNLADRELQLMHAQDAAKVLLRAFDGPADPLRPAGVPTTVAETFDGLMSLHDTYRTGEIPPIGSKHQLDLLNTLRHRMFEQQRFHRLVRREDERGALVETVRAHSSPGQSFVSTTRPGATRGEHFHLRKIERFVVVAGEARISLRRLFTEHRVEIAVRGDEPVAVDMPTGWAHNIVNTGSEVLVTAFWTNELFDPSDADTYPEGV